ncbi:MAG: redoxin domain-containing protein [Lachnospiraceae bacterium]|nr:redoxin domain-containing protein [Lachnospiraceae bacterium]
MLKQKWRIGIAAVALALCSACGAAAESGRGRLREQEKETVIETEKAAAEETVIETEKAAAEETVIETEKATAEETVIEENATEGAAETQKDTETQALTETAPAEETEKPTQWQGISFTTTDVEGNQIEAQELFSAHKVTMVNLWASWCPPCVGELSELEELSHVFAEKDCAIVGLLIDGYDPQEVEDAEALIEKYGLTYTNLLPSGEMGEYFRASAVPTSFFVDENGQILGEPIVGAYPDGYEDHLDELLAQ